MEPLFTPSEQWWQSVRQGWRWTVPRSYRSIGSCTNSLRVAILDGRLQPGAKLPSTRMLAEELAVARNTVMGAYEQLLAEGYLEGETGSGTYVARALPDKFLQAPAV